MTYVKMEIRNVSRLRFELPKLNQKRKLVWNKIISLLRPRKWKTINKKARSVVAGVAVTSIFGVAGPPDQCSKQEQDTQRIFGPACASGL